MTKKDSETKDEIAKGSEAGTAVVAALATASGTALAVAGAAAAAPYVVGKAIVWVIERNNVRMTKWFEAISNKFGNEPDRVRERIESKFLHEGDRTSATVLESADVLLRAVDDALVPAIGALTAEYLQGGCAPDAFFRGALRVLGELTASEAGEFSGFLDACAYAHEEQLEVIIEPGEKDVSHAISDGRDFKLTVQAFRGDRSADPPATISIASAAAMRFFYLLKTHGLARDNPGGFFDTISGPQVLRIQRSTAQRLRALFP